MSHSSSSVMAILSQGFYVLLLRSNTETGGGGQEWNGKGRHRSMAAIPVRAIRTPLVMPSPTGLAQ
ncbi:MAG: hypothetical protein TE42_00055 [Candidatus Synechococcus spongiarum SP3]|uniref:Uncharacterized protein n=1 Tax=Candidatus Synechococcus spongiarum SP3 TaxID=1604020 RepID=A0A0G2HP67_9SYNE|nr:MAG: hypothetical protein TE42_00055 [Candidatus Synechococcus spongiarum SP3]